MTQEYISKFDSEVYSEMKNNPVLKRHHSKYINDKYAPAWKTLEFMTFGKILNLYLGIKDRALKTKIAKQYKCSYWVFLNYMKTIKLLRNSCAHGNCLYNINLSESIKSRPANIEQSNRHNIAGAIKVVIYMLNQISTNRAHDLTQNLTKLLNEQRSRKTNQIIDDCTGLLQLFNNTTCV